MEKPEFNNLVLQSLQWLTGELFRCIEVLMHEHNWLEYYGTQPMEKYKG